MDMGCFFVQVNGKTGYIFFSEFLFAVFQVLPNPLLEAVLFLEFQHLFVASGKNNVDGVDGILSDGFKFSSFVPMIITLVDSFLNRLVVWKRTKFVHLDKNIVLGLTQISVAI